MAAISKDTDPSTLKGMGERARWARLRAGLTQVQLAAKAGIKQPAISSLENGDSTWVRAPNLLRLAVALDVDASWLESGFGPIRHKGTTPDYQFADILHALTDDNRRRYLAMGRALLADQTARPVRPTADNPYPNAPKPPAPRKAPR